MDYASPLKAGRYPEPKLTDFAIERLKKFMVKNGGITKIAQSLGTSRQLIYCWLHKTSKPNYRHIQALEDISQGYITQELMQISEEDFFTLPKTLYDYIEKHFIREKAAIMHITPQHYYKNLIPYSIKEIIETKNLCENNIQTLHAFFGKTTSYWKTVSILYTESVKFEEK
jgi:hypothetical protein